MTSHAYILKTAENPLPIIYDSPHSGQDYPDDFNYACAHEFLSRSEDMYIDDLFSNAPNHGAGLLLAKAPRSYIDLNRAPDDIDPKLLDSPWPVGQINPTARSDAGIGLIRRLIAPGKNVYDRHLSASEIINRIETYYNPYHNTLETLLNNAYDNFGQVWHINCHSMPNNSARPRQPLGMLGHKPKTADFCLGNRDNTTCDIHFAHALQRFLRNLGYTVTINDPFKGVELVKRYSDPTRNRHSLQIEINKRLYMNENTFEKSKNYSKLQTDLNKMIDFISAYVSNNLTALAAD